MFYTVDELAQKIPDGAKVAVPADYAGITMALTRALIRRRARNLHLVGVPVSGLQSEQLIGAGCVTTYESSALTLGEYNPARRFTEALQNRDIKVVDATCPAIHAGLQASQKGAPFMPLRGIIGSDILKHHPDWKVIQNPFSEDEDPVVAIPAIQPDAAIFHALLADRDGNVWIGRRRELVNMSQASKTAYITVEEITNKNLLEDETMAAGTMPSLYVGGIAECKNGTWPLGFWQGQSEDGEHLSHYAEASRTREGFDAYLEEFVFKGEAS